MIFLKKGKNFEKEWIRHEKLHLEKTCKINHFPPEKVSGGGGAVNRQWRSQKKRTRKTWFEVGEQLKIPSENLGVRWVSTWKHNLLSIERQALYKGK